MSVLLTAVLPVPSLTTGTQVVLRKYMLMMNK